MTFQGTTPIAVTSTPAPPPVAEAPPRVEVRDNQIAINEKIQFEYDKATILEVSHSLLDEVADVIKKNSHIKKIQIEGHASAEGSASHNLKLSDQRARAVMKYLVDKGIAANMLVAKGFGVDKPIADNGTETGREANRRVEFNIVDQVVTQKKIEVDAQGNEKVIEEHTLKDSTKKAGG